MLHIIVAMLHIFLRRVDFVISFRIWLYSFRKIKNSPENTNNDDYNNDWHYDIHDDKNYEKKRQIVVQKKKLASNFGRLVG